jgi:uncharacterized membrane protein YhaH (DUF805 family)
MHASPYQPPRSALAPPVSTEYGPVGWFSTQGRLGRVRYIGYAIGLVILINAAALLLGGLAGLAGLAGLWVKNSNDFFQWLFGGVLGVLGVAALLMSLLFTVRRLHDFDASGWWSLLLLLPLVNLVLYLLLLIMPGTQGANRFGAPPPPNSTGVIVLAAILPLLFALGVVAAIAIPALQQFHHRAERLQGPTQP